MRWFTTQLVSFDCDEPFCCYEPIPKKLFPHTITPGISAVVTDRTVAFYRSVF